VPHQATYLTKECELESALFKICTSSLPGVFSSSSSSSSLDLQTIQGMANWRIHNSLLVFNIRHGFFSDYFNDGTATKLGHIVTCATGSGLFQLCLAGVFMVMKYPRQKNCGFGIMIFTVL